MKRYLISSVAIVMVLAVAWAAFGQREGQGSAGSGERRRFQQLSEEERAQMRERWQNMSEEEREKFRAQMRERFGGMRRGMSQEEQLKAIKAVEGELAKLKAGIEAAGSQERRPFSELSEEERTKLRESFAKAREERQKAIQEIITQIARLQGQRQPTEEGEQFIIINTADLKSISELAVKEKAKETADRLERLMRRGRRGAGIRPAGRRATTGATSSGGPRNRAEQR